MKVSIGFSSKSIPRILNGDSANSLFYLINMKKESMKNAEKVGCYNSSTISMPHDLDDFSRCYLASISLNWNDADFKIALENAKEIELPKYFIDFIENFEELVRLYAEDKKLIVERMAKMFPNGFWR